MPYEYLEHQADIGIRAWGCDYPEALAEAVRALAALMVEPEGVEPATELTACAEAPSRELLAVELLNEVLSLLGFEELALAEVGPVERRFGVRQSTPPAMSWAPRARPPPTRASASPKPPTAPPSSASWTFEEEPGRRHLRTVLQSLGHVLQGEEPPWPRTSR